MAACIASTEFASALEVKAETKPRIAQSELFSIHTFRSQHSQRVKYLSKPGDEDLLQHAGALVLEVAPPGRRPASAAGAAEAAVEGPVEAPAASDGACCSTSLVPSLSSANGQLVPKPASCPLQPVDDMANHPLLSMRPTAEQSASRRTELIYRNYAPTTVTPTSLPLITDCTELIAEDAVLLRVAILDGHEWRREFIVHGKQTLLELSERIRCATTDQIAWQQETIMKQLGQANLPEPFFVSDSACFFIEGNFFTSGEIDISEPTRERLLAGSSSSTEYQAYPMATTTFEMLQLRLGRQYLFVHLGDCEHAVIFTDCWLRSSVDPRNASAYPQVVFQRKAAAKMCCVCARHGAAWECHGDRLADTSPCFLCDNCHYQFHYSASGEALRTDYMVFKYFPK